MKDRSSKDSISKETMSNIGGLGTPVLTFIVGVILSLSVFSLVREWEQAELMNTFELSARNRLAALQAENN